MSERCVMKRDDVGSAIRDFFSQRGKSIPSDAADLFANEIIDSMELLALVIHLEEKFGLEIDQEMMTVDNFRTVNSIINTVMVRSS